MRTKAKPQAEPTGEPPCDFTDLKLVRTVLEDAFEAYRPPSALDKIPEHPTKKHPRDIRKRDGSYKLTPLEAVGKFNLENCMTLLGIIALSMFFKPSCAVIGITYKTGCLWVQKGLSKDEPVGSPYWVFAHAFRTIAAVCEGRMLQTMHGIWRANPGDPAIAREIASFLRMRYPQRWAEHSKVDVTSNGQTVGGDTRALRGINLVVVDAATCTIEGHSFIYEKKSDADEDEVPKTPEALDLEDFLK